MNTRKCVVLTWFSVTPTEQYMQFSKKPIMANFGDLVKGEIPEPLKFNRPFRKCPFLALLSVLFF